MKKKIERIKCTSLGSYLADPSPDSPGNLARFILEVSPKAFESEDPPSSAPDPTPLQGDWTPVTRRISNLNPIQEISMSERNLRDILQGSDRVIEILVDDNIKSYRILAYCGRCPSEFEWFVAASGSFEL